MSKRNLVIDIGSRKIKILEMKYKKKKPKVYKFIEIDTPDSSIKDGEIVNVISIRECIEGALKKEKIRSKKVLIAIKSGSIIVREITIPKTSEKNIRGIVSREIEQYLPLEFKHYLIEYRIMEVLGEKIKVRIELYQKNIIKNYYELCKDMGLTPVAMDSASNALRKLYKYNIHRKPLDEQVVFIDLGEESIMFNGFENGELQFTRTIEGGFTEFFYNYPEVISKKDLQKKLNHINEQNDEVFINAIEQQVVFWAREVERLMNYYKNNLRKEPKHIILHGGNSKIPGIDKIFSEIIGYEVKNIEQVVPIKKEDKGSGMGVLPGVLLRKKGVRDINFFRNFQESELKKRKSRRIGAAVAVTLFAAGGSSFLYFKIQNDDYMQRISGYNKLLSSNGIKEREEELLSTKKTLDDMKTFYDEMMYLERYSSEYKSITGDDMRSILWALTPDVVVDSFSMDKYDFSIRCSAPTMKDVFESVATLKDMGCDDVEFSDITIVEKDGVFNSVFSINGKISREEKKDD